MKLEYMMFALPLKSDIVKAPENLEMELINLQCDTNLIQKLGSKIVRFLFILTKDNCLQFRSLGLRNDCNI